MKSFGLSLEDAWDQNKWRKEVNGQLDNADSPGKCLSECCMHTCVCVFEKFRIDTKIMQSFFFMILLFCLFVCHIKDCIKL